MLFTSGYTQNAIVHGGRLDPGVELISKPYRREDLARKVRHVFNNARQVSSLREEHQRVSQLPLAPSTSGWRILVVEDEADNRSLLQELLTLLGHYVVSAPDAEQGLAEYAPGRFDVLLTDMNLPGISGLALAAALRSTQPSLKVVVASGQGVVDDEMRQAGYRSLLKPYRIDQLQAALT